MARTVTIDEAARLLGCSRRTIERRIDAGALVATRDGKRRYVSLPDDAPHGAPVSDVDVLRAQLEAVTSERDNLRQQFAQLSATLYQFTAQRTLPETTRTAHPERPWWKVWR